MPELTQFALFFAAAAVLAVTPGPGIFYVAARTLAGGRAEGLASSFGTGLGGMVHVLAGSIGVWITPATRATMPATDHTITQMVCSEMPTESAAW